MRAGRSAPERRHDLNHVTATQAGSAASRSGLTALNSSALLLRVPDINLVNTVCLPAGRFHNLGDRRAVRASKEADDLSGFGLLWRWPSFLAVRLVGLGHCGAPSLVGPDIFLALAPPQAPQTREAVVVLNRAHLCRTFGRYQCFLCSRSRAEFFAKCWNTASNGACFRRIFRHLNCEVRGRIQFSSFGTVFGGQNP